MVPAVPDRNHQTAAPLQDQPLFSAAQLDRCRRRFFKRPLEGLLGRGLVEIARRSASGGGKSKLKKRAARQPRGAATPNAAALLRGGLAVASDRPLAAHQVLLSELAGRAKASASLDASVDWTAEAQAAIAAWTNAAAGGQLDAALVGDALLWAHAAVPLSRRLESSLFDELIETLLAIDGCCAEILDLSSPVRLLGGEIALALSLRLDDLVADHRVQQATNGLLQWCERGELGIDEAIRDAGRDARLVLASGLRQVALIKVISRRRVKRKLLGTLVDLACWVVALTRHDGTPALLEPSVPDCRDDIAPGGLLDCLLRLDPELLTPAVSAALGRSRSRGRLAWAISLPESFWYSEAAALAALLPEWDVRRGRTYVDHGDQHFRLEVQAGRQLAIRGDWDVTLVVDGQQSEPVGAWSTVCQYSDDDAQYLECEQPWTGGVVLQRQVMVLRDDRVVMLADAVIRDPSRPPAQISYAGRIPLAGMLQAVPEAETTEHWLVDDQQRRRALVLSLGSSEWRCGPAAVKVGITPEQQIATAAATEPPADNGGSLFIPLWFDFQSRRFQRPRTHRRLTVADELRIVDADNAVAARIQMGSEQWVIYRSLRGRRTRTFLGKHLLADFYCARFDPGDGSMEDLLTVGEADE